MAFAKQWGTVCPRCVYRDNFAARKKPETDKKPGKKRTIGTIDEIIAKQKRIYEETGRWITYGEIVARKNNG